MASFRPMPTAVGSASLARSQGQGQGQGQGLGYKSATTKAVGVGTGKRGGGDRKGEEEYSDWAHWTGQNVFMGEGDEAGGRGGGGRGDGSMVFRRVASPELPELMEDRATLTVDIPPPLTVSLSLSK